MQLHETKNEHSMIKLARAMTVLMLLQILAGCVPVAVGTATVVAIDLVMERRTIGRVIDDNTLEIKLRNQFIADENLNSTHLSTTVMNGIVLFTGEVATDDQRQYVAKLARSYTETREIINELEISGKTSITSRVNDTYITAKTKSKLIGAKSVPATNIKVATERGKVYLMGLVTRAEGDEAAAIAKTVRGVTHTVKVFEYIK